MKFCESCQLTEGETKEVESEDGPETVCVHCGEPILFLKEHDDMDMDR